MIISKDYLQKKIEKANARWVTQKPKENNENHPWRKSDPTVVREIDKIK